MKVEFPSEPNYPPLRCFVPNATNQFIGVFQVSGSDYGSYFYANYFLVDGKFYRSGRVNYVSQSDSQQVPYCSSNFVQLYPDNPVVYKPELEVYFPVIAFCIICFLTYFIYNIIIKRLLP